MWTRKGVKQKGKKSFFGNYWKCVLVALILSIVIGAGASGGSGTGSAIGSASGALVGYSNNKDSYTETIAPSDLDELLGDDFDGDDFNIDIDFDEGDGVITHVTADDEAINGIISGAFVAAFLFVLILSLIIAAIAIVIRYLLLAPFEYGCRKFFRKNLDEPAKLSNIVYVFDSNYKNIVKTAFLRDLFIFLWSLLFIVPGIIKSYQYRMVPYIVSENPSISYKDALAESKKLMHGNKWRAFVLDLSFLGWDILSLLTFGLVGIFFVDPYKASTDAALYESIKYGIEAA